MFLYRHTLVAHLHAKSAIGKAIHIKLHIFHHVITVFLPKIFHYFLLHLVTVPLVLIHNKRKPHCFTRFGLAILGKVKVTDLSGLSE